MTEADKVSNSNNLPPSLLGRLCFSNKPFWWIKRIFFHRWLLWGGGILLAVGLPTAVIGAQLQDNRVLLIGLLLTWPFQFWLALLAVISFIFAIPRLLFLSLALVCFYFGVPGINAWLVKWEEEQTKRLNPEASG